MMLFSITELSCSIVFSCLNEVFVRQVVEREAFAGGLGDEVYSGRDSLFCGSQQAINDVHRSPYRKILAVSPFNSVIYKEKLFCDVLRCIHSKCHM